MGERNQFGIITNAKGLKKENIVFSQLMPNRTGGASTMFINTSEQSKFRFQLNNIYLPFGLSEWKQEGVAEDGKKSIDLSFRDQTDQLTEFRKFVDLIDSLILEKCIKGELLDTPKTKEVALELGKPSIKKDNTGKYSDTMKIGINTKQSKLFDKKRREMDFSLENIPKGSIVDVIVELSFVYVVGKKNYGIVWRVGQMKIKETVRKLPDCAFTYEDGDSEWDEDDLDGAPYKPYNGND